MRRMLVNTRQPIFGFGDDICFMELRLGRAKKMMTLVMLLFGFAFRCHSRRRCRIITKQAMWRQLIGAIKRMGRDQLLA